MKKQHHKYPKAFKSHKISKEYWFSKESQNEEPIYAEMTPGGDFKDKSTFFGKSSSEKMEEESKTSKGESSQKSTDQSSQFTKSEL